MLEGGEIQYRGTAQELKDEPELLHSAYLLRDGKSRQERLPAARPTTADPRRTDDAAVKVTIVGGAGGVGASTAFNLALLRGGHEVVLVDNRPEMITSHVMDLDQVLELSPGCTVRGGELGDVRDADVVVLISATPITAGTPRVEYLARNALIADELAGELTAPWAGTILVVTNPVDPIVTRLQQRIGLDRRRVLGYTINDSLRFRTGLARALGVPPGAVEAWVLGEHGDKAVPLFDRVDVNGERVRPPPSKRRRRRSTSAAGT